MDVTGKQIKSSNIACYGDSGRFPLAIKLAKQAVSYYNRLDNFDTAGVQSLARHAFVEQRTNNYSWHNSIHKIMQKAGHFPKRPCLSHKDQIQLRIPLQHPLG